MNQQHILSSDKSQDISSQDNTSPLRKMQKIIDTYVSPYGSSSSKFPLNVLEELFLFLFKHKHSLIGNGDLVPFDIDNFTNDLQKEASAQWLGHKHTISDRTYYESCLINGILYNIFDHVILSTSYDNNNLNVAKIIAFYEDDTAKRVTLEWFYRPIDILPTMKKIKETGRHPLIPVTEDPFDDSPDAKKKKRGRPPNKRLFHVEETIAHLEEASEFELFTSLRPYVDDLSVSALGNKCIVDFVQPNYSHEEINKTNNIRFYYKKTLEFKICMLSTCKPRPNKPKLWMEQLEKKNREIKTLARKYSENFFNNIAMTSAKKTKRDDNDVTYEKSSVYNESELELRVPHKEPINNLSEIANFDSIDKGDTEVHNSEMIYSYIKDSIEHICNIVPTSLNRMEKSMDKFKSDVQNSLEDMMTTLDIEYISLI